MKIFILVNFLVVCFGYLYKNERPDVTAAEQTLSWNLTDIIRPDFVGTNAVRHGFDYMEESTYRGMTDELRQIGYDRLKASRVNIVRTWSGSDWVMPNGWGSPLNFSTDRFQQFARWIGDMQQLNISVQLNAGWWFPQNACSPAQNPPCLPTAADVSIYTSWISNLIHELVVQRNFDNVNSLLLFTEPNGQGQGNTSYNSIVRDLHNRMIADGTRKYVSFQGPNYGGINNPDVLDKLKVNVQELSDVLDIFSSHTYNLPDYTSWYDLYSSTTALTTKPYYVDEGGFAQESVRNQSDYGTYLAVWQAALMNAGAASSFVWIWSDQYYVYPLQNQTNADSFYNGLQRWGLSFWPAYSTDVRPGFYSQSILTRFLRPPQGAETVSTTRVNGGLAGGVWAAAVIGLTTTRPDYHAILLVNEGQTQVNVTVDIVGGNTSPDSLPSLQRYAYDPANPPDDMGSMVLASGSVPVGTSVLVDSIPPRGVVVWASPWEEPGFN